MKKQTFFLIILLNSLMCFAQNDFPDSWVGNYEGNLEIFGKKDVKMHVNMKLEIQPKTDSVYSWHLIYKMNGKEDKRLYELKVLDKEKGHYIIDEKNSIVIDGYYHLNRFSSMFEVNGSYIVSAYTKEGTSLVFEIIAGNLKDSTVSGNTEKNGEQIPEVKSYPVNGRQKAVLKKVG